MGDEAGAGPQDSHPLVLWLHDELTPIPFELSLVVTTSQQAATSLRRALLRLRCEVPGLDGLLGVHFLAAAGLARTLLQLVRVPHPHRTADPLLEREILRGCLEEHQGEVSRYAARYPGALLRLLAAVKELQAAGWPEPQGQLSPWGQQVRAIGATYRGRTHALASRGRLMELALRAIGKADGGDLPRQVLLTGYPHPERDLILLLEQLEARGVEVRRSPPGEETPANMARHSAPDLADELRLAARLCLEAARDGVCWTEMVVAAPSLGPYAALLQRAFDAEGVPFTAKAERSLLHEPRAGFYRHAACLLADQGPRAAYMALASSPLLRQPPEARELEQLERLSREHLLEGKAADLDWFLELLEQKLSEGDDSGHLGGLLRSLKSAAQEPAANLPQQCRRLDRFAKLVLAPAESPRDRKVSERIEECLQAMEKALPPVKEGAAFVSQLHELFEQRGLPIQSGLVLGVRVVEYRDALSFPAAHLHLLGLSSKLFPRPGTGEFLDQSDRKKMQGVTNREEVLGRQRELLHRAVSHPTRSLVFSHSRTAEPGRPANRSPWLDEVLQTLSRSVPEVWQPAHPEARAQGRVESGLCPRDLATAYLSLKRARLRDLAAVAGREAASWGRNARRLDSFRPRTLAWDGDVGAELAANRAAAGLRVTDLEKLGRCPHQFLFARLMNLEPLPRELDPLDLRRDRLGSLIHQVLDQLQREFHEEMASPNPRRIGTQMAQRARELLKERWHLESTMLGRGLNSLRTVLQDRWAESLARAVQADLGILEDERRIPAEIEAELRETITVARPGAISIELDMIGRPDRVDRTEEGLPCILDFKTGRTPHRSVDTNSILGGRDLQLVVYGLMLRGAGGVAPKQLEIRPIHPTALERGDPRLIAPIDYFRGKYRDAMDETLAVLGELLLRGALVPNPEPRRCSDCEFNIACRRLHPPSAERVRNSGLPEVQRYFALAGKSKTRPLLSDGETQ